MPALHSKDTKEGGDVNNMVYSLAWEPVVEEEKGLVYKAREEFNGIVNEGYMVVTDKMYVEIDPDAEG